MVGGGRFYGNLVILPGKSIFNQVNWVSLHLGDWGTLQLLQRGPGVEPWENSAKLFLLDATNSHFQSLSAATENYVMVLFLWIYLFCRSIDSWGSDWQLWQANFKRHKFSKPQFWRTNQSRHV